MIKKISIILVLAIQFLYSTAQVKTVELNVNESEPIEVEIDRCPCVFSLTAIQNGNSDITLSIDVINTQSSHYIFLFGHAYTEKDLKKQNIVFDKSYGSTSRKLELCEELMEKGNDIMVIEPSKSRTLSYDNISDPIKTCKINLYAAKYKEKSFLSTEKYNIVEFIPITLNVKFKVEEIAEDEYEDIMRRCEELIEDIGNITICPRRSHPSTKIEQKKQYQDKIDELKNSINDIKSAHNWHEIDEDYQKYKELLTKLENVKFRERYCGRCESTPRTPKILPPSHNCKYCSETPSTIYNQIGSIYKKLDGNRIGKDTALKTANALRQAWTGGCPNLTKQMKNSSKRNGIEKYYNAIKNY